MPIPFQTYLLLTISSISGAYSVGLPMWSQGTSRWKDVSVALAAHIPACFLCTMLSSFVKAFMDSTFSNGHNGSGRDLASNGTDCGPIFQMSHSKHEETRWREYQAKWLARSKPDIAEASNSKNLVWTESSRTLCIALVTTPRCHPAWFVGLSNSSSLQTWNFMSCCFKTK